MHEPAALLRLPERVAVEVRPRAAERRVALTRCALAAVLLIAAALRGVGLDWGEGLLLHPDERFLAIVHGALAPASSFRDYLDTAHSGLNPNNRGVPFFVYGSLPLFTVRGLTNLQGELADLRGGGAGGEGMAGATLVGRAVSMAADLVSLLLLFAIGRRLYGRATGVLAAALYAAAVLPIQLAHFSTVDSYANAFAVLAFWASVRLLERPRWTADVLLGVAAALGAACKLSVAPVLLLGVVAALLRLAGRRRAAPAPAGDATEDTWFRAAAGVNVSVLVALFVFRVAQPYAFVPARTAAPDAANVAATLTDLLFVRLNPEWRGQMKLVGEQVQGRSDFPPLHQWANRSRLAHAWLQSVRFGLGWPLGLAAWLAWLGAAAEILRRRSGWRRHVLPVLWIAFVFLWNGSQFAVTMRYFLPAYPALALLAAWGLVRLARERDADEGGAPVSRIAGVALLALVLVGTYSWAFAFAGIYARPHTRIAASRWIYEHVPRGATIATEGTWDDDLPLPLAEHDLPKESYRMTSLEMSAEDGVEKRARMQDVLDRADVLVLSSNRFYASLSRLPRRWPMSIEYYRALFDGRLGFALVGDFSSPPRLGALALDDQAAEESFTVYDHPRVFVFRKSDAYSAARTAAILASADLALVRRERAVDVRDAPARIDVPHAD